ncbi:hypothetical protein ACJQWK_00860 [Exserohilum turcicum]
MKHIAPSKARIALLGDYLLSVSKSIVVDLNAAVRATKPVRNRMDLLLIVNDVLHTDKYHRRSTMKQGLFCDECGGFVAELIAQAAACITEKNSQAEKKLKAIVNYWTVNQLASADCLKLCRERADEALLIAQGGTPARKRNYLLPEYHGDRTAPWYDLPASYMLEPMIKHPKRPIDPSQIKIQKLDKKPVSPHVRNLLDNFFEKIDLKYAPTGDNPTGETAKYKLSLDPLGQLAKQDKETGDIATVANGYGWSTKFCQDMQKHGVPENIKIAREDIARMEDDADIAPGRSASRDERRHRRSPSSDSDYRQGRRRYSRSRSRSRSRSYSRRGSQSSYDSRQSPQRSRSRDMAKDHRKGSPRPGRRGADDRDRRYESQGSNQSRERSQRESQWGGPGGHNRSAQGSPSNQHHPTPPMPPQNYGQPYSQPSQPPFNTPPFPPQPGQFQGQFPMPMPPFGVPPPPPPQFPGASVFVPPPPPPNYNGPWPPPPPNMNVPPGGPQTSNQYGNKNSGVYNQTQGGYQGGRGYGGAQRGGYNGNRGNWRGGGHGGRY